MHETKGPALSRASETLGICDRAYILSGGVILEEGAPEVIAASKRARELYLGERFSL